MTMPGNRGRRSQDNGASTVQAGENLQRAFPVKKDGTFASFLTLLEELEAVQTTVDPPD